MQATMLQQSYNETIIGTKNFNKTKYRKYVATFDKVDAPEIGNNSLEVDIEHNEPDLFQVNKGNNELLNYTEKVYSHSFMVNIDNVTTTRIGLTAFEKVGALTMTLLPSYITEAASDIKESFVQDMAFKAIFSVFFAGLISFLGGVSVVSLLGIVILAAVIDAVVSILPGVLKPGTEADHTLQKKLIQLTVNILAIFVVVKIHLGLSSFSSDNSLFSFVGENFHFAIIGWIFGIYVIRLIQYIAQVNNVKVPNIFSWNKKDKP